MDSLWLDLKYGCRALLQRPGFTGLAVLTLALGLGVNAVAFSAIDALLLRPFRMADADRSGWIMLGRSGVARGEASLDEYNALHSVRANCSTTRTVSTPLASNPHRSGERKVGTPSSTSCCH